MNYFGLSKLLCVVIVECLSALHLFVEFTYLIAFALCSTIV